jgi:hypothetical protein
VTTAPWNPDLTGVVGSHSQNKKQVPRSNASAE